MTGSWLQGPPVDRLDGQAWRYPGERLGRPEQGAGSVCGPGRRLGALIVDWAIALLAAAGISGTAPLSPGHSPLLPLAIFALEYLLFVSLLGTTIGMRLLGMRVESVTGGRLRVPWVVVRTILLILVVPAVIYDRDYRGLHDRAANSVVVRAARP